MKSIHRSILTRALMTGVASLAFVMVSAGGVRAEIVTVQGDDGAAGADGVNPGDPGMPGGDGESVSASAGSTQPITAPLNKATATGGNGGQGGNGCAPSPEPAAMAAAAARRSGDCGHCDDHRLRLGGSGRKFLRRHRWRRRPWERRQLRGAGGGGELRRRRRPLSRARRTRTPVLPAGMGGGRWRGPFLRPATAARAEGQTQRRRLGPSVSGSAEADANSLGGNGGERRRDTLGLPNGCGQPRAATRARRAPLQNAGRSSVASMALGGRRCGR